MMERDKFKKIAAQTGDPKDYADYKSLRNEVVYKLRHAEKDYFKVKFSDKDASSSEI